MNLSYYRANLSGGLLGLRWIEFDISVMILNLSLFI